MAKVIYKKVFKNKIRVDVYETGVTLWDLKAGRWIVDASCIADDNIFAVGHEIFERLTAAHNPMFPAFYPKGQTKKKKLVRKKK